LHCKELRKEVSYIKGGILLYLVVVLLSNVNPFHSPGNFVNCHFY